MWKKMGRRGAPALADGTWPSADDVAVTARAEPNAATAANANANAATAAIARSARARGRVSRSSASGARAPASSSLSSGARSERREDGIATRLSG